jgi:hypothetical protein
MTLDFSKSSLQLDSYAQARGYSKTNLASSLTHCKLVSLSLSKYEVCWQTKFNPSHEIIDEFKIDTGKTIRCKYLVDYKASCLIERLGH